MENKEENTKAIVAEEWKNSVDFMLTRQLEQLKSDPDQAAVAEIVAVVRAVNKAAGVEIQRLLGKDVTALEAELRKAGDPVWTDYYRSSTDSETDEQGTDTGHDGRVRRITGTEGKLVEGTDGWELRVPLGRLSLEKKEDERRG